MFWFERPVAAILWLRLREQKYWGKSSRLLKLKYKNMKDIFYILKEQVRWSHMFCWKFCKLAIVIKKCERWCDMISLIALDKISSSIILRILICTSPKQYWHKKLTLFRVTFNFMDNGNHGMIYWLCSICLSYNYGRKTSWRSCMLVLVMWSVVVCR